MSSKSFLHSPKTCWLIVTGGFITDIASKNWDEQISSLLPGEIIFPIHCILHASDFFRFTADLLKQLKKHFINLLILLLHCKM